MYRIREVIKDDIKGIYNLSLQLGYDYLKEKMDSKLNSIINDSSHKIFVAVDGDIITGYIHVELYRVLFANDLLNILGIVVNSSFRLKGVGRSLINVVEEYAKEIGCSGIRANSGISRKKAHLFYESNGFFREPDQKRFYKTVD